MVRRGQAPRREERRANRALRADLDGRERGDYVPPHRDDCRHRSWFQSLDDSDTLRIDHHLWRADGRLVDFAIIVAMLGLDGVWSEVARVDCCHGYAHLHHHGGETSAIAALDDVADVARAFEAATARMTAYAVTIRDMRSTHG